MIRRAHTSTGSARQSVLATAVLCTMAATAGAATSREELPVRDTQRVERTVAFAAPGPGRVEVDNVWGSIDVQAHDGPDIRLTATRTVRARTDADVEAARREVTLDVTAQGALVSIAVNGPFRSQCDCGGQRPREPDGSRGWGRGRDRDRHDRAEPGYNVRYDFVLGVPRASALSLRTVNDGEIHVRGTGGAYEIENVNGGVEMVDIAGAGRVYALNGSVKVTFRENPRAPSSFGSLNGQVVASFRPALAADLRLKTFNGSVYTDFDVVTVPASAPAPVTERRNGRFTYKSDRGYAVRVGGGGPELSFDAFNGDIRILRQGT